ncbi:hypothetical protein SAMN05660860_02945 [Geoalkalibacter ferrihydriticus]|uniref:ABC-type glycine betaine transport system substrate-binding domain-containing protein n=2 Tax=Geoalkalibacter ferrihydriticus TaxID=392333 RepID=A0A0C2HSQ8_9BACT|nr:hypothetical protein [Geoalkalibacter ferrihydriticus]KIH75807.1 hypothetical protein GFER_14530 [Geoalkalibacter ferrihydriticus DSM 17813]SDM65892.1 hypothetical protein SAMN05660860_02945 [Geoalkalibacter ferrihydriticus]
MKIFRLLPPAGLLLVLVSVLWLGSGAFSAAQACYGPKIFIGVGTDVQERVFYEVVSLYVKEKTGVETVAVALEDDAPVEALGKNRVDMAFVPEDVGEYTSLVTAVGSLLLISDRRPLDDLQFTTVAPALRRLDGLLTPELFTELVAQVRAGEPPAAAARALLMRHRWI